MRPFNKRLDAKVGGGIPLARDEARSLSRLTRLLQSLYPVNTGARRTSLPCREDVHRARAERHAGAARAQEERRAVDATDWGEENVESLQATTPSWVRYVVPEQIASHTIADTDAVPVNSTVEATGQAIRQGEDGSLVTGDDFYIRFSSHYTYNGNGDLTASFSDFTTECR